MDFSSLLGSKKMLYVVMGVIAFILLMTVVLILGNVGGGEGTQAKLEFWGVYDERQDFSKLLTAFQQIEPGVKINYRQFQYEDYERELLDALAAGTGPDLIMIHHTWLAKHRDKFYPMPDTSGIKEVIYLTPVEFQKQFVDVAYKDLVYQDKIYAIPLYVDTLGLFYNKDMFNTAGITRPPKDWQEFNKDVELLTKFDEDGNIIQAGAAIGTARNINRSTDILSMLMLQNGTKMTNATNTGATFTRSVNSERTGENALEYYTDFANPLKKVYTWDSSQHYSIDSFIEGSLAMMFNYSHQIDIVRGRFDRLNFAVAPVPQADELDSSNYANYFAVAVSNQSKSKNAAWRFLNYLASHDGTMQYIAQTLRPSARRDVIDIQRNDARLGVFAVQALSAKSWFQIDNTAIDQIFADMIENVNTKKETVRAALRAAESKINTLMVRAGQ